MQKLITRVSEMDFLQRAVVFAVVGVVGGSTVLGFLNRYALYVYAYSEGIRVPVEGVPYLDFAVSLIAFVFLAIATINTVLVYSFFDWLNHMAVVKDAFIEASRSVTKYAGVLATSAGLVGTVVGMIQVFRAISVGETQSAEHMGEALSVALKITLFGALLGISTVFLLMYTRLSKTVIRRIAIAYVGAAFLAIIVAMFQPSFYGAFLREINFGGGIPVEIAYRDTESERNILAGSLVVYSNSGVIIQTEDSDKFIEIYRDRISSISYLDKVSE